MASRVLLGVIAVIGGGMAACGATYTGGIEYGAGSGGNKATIAVDFDYGVSFLFEYRWDGQATGWDALSAVSQAGALDVKAMDYGVWGMFVDDISYPGATKYDYGAGANTGWAYYVGEDNQNWQLNSTGVSLRSLSNGVWDSWVWTNYPADWSGPLRQPGAKPIPEPCTALAFGLGWLLWARKK